jgi:hypothetical protein
MEQFKKWNLLNDRKLYFNFPSQRCDVTLGDKKMVALNASKVTQLTRLKFYILIALVEKNMFSEWKNVALLQRLYFKRFVASELQC